MNVNEEIKKELEYLMKGADDPLHVVGNFPYLIAKCYQVGEIPQEAWELFGKALNNLGVAWRLAEIIKSLQQS
jgi:hypothetical protein